jgi:hypothetical protein
MSTPSRKRRVISLDLKKKIIDASTDTKKSDDLSKQFGVPASSIRNILRDKAAILKAIEEGGEAKRVKLRGAKQEDLEEAVLQWFKSVRSNNMQISGPLLAVRFS